MISWRCFFSRRVTAVILARKSPEVMLTMASSAVPLAEMPPDSRPKKSTSGIFGDVNGLITRGRDYPSGDKWIVHPKAGAESFEPRGSVLNADFVRALPLAATSPALPQKDF